MSDDRWRVRCLGCGKWTRRSRCSTCRVARRQAKAVATPGRTQRKAIRQAKAHRHR